MANPVPATRADARLNRERLRNAAREVLKERGFDAEIMEIAERAGVGAGTVYRHFASKEALILAVGEELNTATMSALAGVQQVEDAREAIALTMQIGFRRAEQYGQFVVALVAGTEPQQYRHIIDREALAKFFAHLIRRGIAQGHFRPDLDIEYSVSIWFALVAPQALSALMEQRSLHEIAAATTEFFLAGLGCDPAGISRSIRRLD